MMKKRTIIKCVVGLVIAVAVLAIRNTDLIFVGVSVLFFLVCAAYAEGCERL